MPGMSKIFTYIIHSFVPQIFIEHDKRGLYNMQGSVQSENVGASVQKARFLLSSVASLSTIMVSFLLAV